VGSGEIPDKWAAKAAPLNPKGCRVDVTMGMCRVIIWHVTGKGEGSSPNRNIVKVWPLLWGWLDLPSNSGAKTQNTHVELISLWNGFSRKIKKLQSK